MNIKGRIKEAVIRIILLLGIVVIAVSFSSAASHAAAKSKKLPTVVTTQEKINGKWKTLVTIKYKYNKHSDPVRITYNIPGDGSYTVKLKHKYKKGIKTKTTATSPVIGTNTFRYNKAGQLTKITEAGSKDAWTFHYDKKGFLRSRKWRDSYGDTYLISFRTKLKKGKPVKTVIKDPEELYRYTSSMLPLGPGTRRYNGKGLIKSVTFDGFTHKVSYKITKGLVRERTVIADNGETLRTKYKYGKAKAKAKKYYKVINNDERIIVSNIEVMFLGDY